jgi:6-phosphofructokinase 1
MEDALIAPAGNDVTPAFFDYLRPLLGADMPVAGRLRAPSVARVLKR